MIPSNGYLVLSESTGTDTSTVVYLGMNISWNPSYAGAVSLLNSSRAGVDFVRWGSSTVIPNNVHASDWTGPNPDSPPAGKSLGRDHLGTDTDRGSDWYSQEPSLGYINDGGYRVNLPLVKK